MPVPNTGRRRSKPYLTPEQFETIVAKISEPYELMVLVAIYTGLRAELTGLRWNDLGDNTIDERYCGGDCSQKRNGRLIVGSHAETAVLIGSVK